MKQSRVVQTICLSLSVVGAVVAGYLAVAHYTSPSLLVCSDRGMVDCAQVTSSPESTIAGVPVAVLGVFFFLAMSFVSLPAAWRSQSRGIKGARLGLVWVGMCLVLWLIYAELFLIHAICLYCSLVHVITFALFVLILFNNGETDQSKRPADAGLGHA